MVTFIIRLSFAGEVRNELAFSYSIKVVQAQSYFNTQFDAKKEELAKQLQVVLATSLK